MSRFTELELEYLGSQPLGRIATVGADRTRRSVSVSSVHRIIREGLDTDECEPNARTVWT